ncbi:transposase family protein [Streptomyces sp. NPDC001586]|uniref:transposase family protein n=1 Tax=Streptomyces sp. NPDC001586 TaxID=3154387 RepID=UPI00332ECE0E
MVGNGTRAAIISDQRITGLSTNVIAELVAEVGPLWHERHQARLEARPRQRAVGAGAKHRLVFIDRLLATLVHPRHGATHDVPACWFGVDRSTITRAIGEVRPLLAARGCTIAAGIRLRTLAEVIDHLGASGQTGIIDGTEIRVRRPAVGRKDREKFISGKNKQNAVKSMVLTDASGRLLFCSPAQPASCADITHARQLGLVKHLTDGPAVEILADAGYQVRQQLGDRIHRAEPERLNSVKAGHPRCHKPCQYLRLILVQLERMPQRIHFCPGQGACQLFAHQATLPCPAVRTPTYYGAEELQH